MKVLIVGISTRAFSQSAVAAGYEVTSLDFFGDRDQPKEAEVIALSKDLNLPLTTKALATAAMKLADRVDAVLIASGIENEPAFFRLAHKNLLWLNNPKKAVRQVRDARFLQLVAAETGVHIPRTIYPGEELPVSGAWLLKDLRHSGGRGVRVWDRRRRIPRGCILQELVEGTLCSLAFVANGKQAVFIGTAYQYAGVKELGAPPFAWCGNAVPLGKPEVEKVLWPFVQVLVEKSSLVGINGLDFMLVNGIPWILEINPRPGASIDLFERLGGFNAFQMQIDAIKGKLPEAISYPAHNAVARGIVYARQDVTILDHPEWLSGRYGDIPHPGEQIPAGAPLCSIYCRGDTAEMCWEDILDQARALPGKHFFRENPNS